MLLAELGCIAPAQASDAIDADIPNGQIAGIYFTAMFTSGRLQGARAIRLTLTHGNGLADSIRDHTRANIWDGTSETFGQAGASGCAHSLNEYEGITCPACAKLHFINRKTGKLLGQDE